MSLKDKLPASAPPVRAIPKKKAQATGTCMEWRALLHDTAPFTARVCRRALKRYNLMTMCSARSAEGTR